MLNGLPDTELYFAGDAHNLINNGIDVGKYDSSNVPLHSLVKVSQLFPPYYIAKCIPCKDMLTAMMMSSGFTVCSS